MGWNSIDSFRMVYWVLDKGTIQGVPTEAIASSIFTVTATDSDTGQTSIVVLLISIIDPNAIIENETLTPEPVTDTDGDGFEDEFEEFCRSHPVDSSSMPQSQNSETCRAAISAENLEDPPAI